MGRSKVAKANSFPFFSASGPLAPCLRSVSVPPTTYLSEAANRRQGPWHLYETPTPGNFETGTKNKSINQMTVLITKQNVPFFMSLTGLTKEDFVSETKHTCTFRLSQERFEVLYERVRQFDNPYALMSW